MSKDLIVTTSGDRASKTRETWRPLLTPAKTGTAPTTPLLPDEVRLSAFHKALTFAEIAERIERLELQVSRNEYSVPSSEVSRSIIKEHQGSVNL